MIGAILAAALAAAPRPAGNGGQAKPPVQPQQAGAASDAGAPAKDGGGKETAASAPAAEADQHVMAFLSLTRSTATSDGGADMGWNGPGAAQMRLSLDALEKRNELLAEGDMMARSLIESVRMYYQTEGGLEPDAMRAKLASLVGAPLDDARASYLESVTWEERRLFFVDKALIEAGRQGIPGVDAALVRRRLAAIRSGAVKKALEDQLEGYRNLALGLVAYLDGDSFGALQRVRSAAAALPDFAVAHAFLGSLYFLFDQKDAAVVAWRRSNELDPSNAAVREALMEYGRTTKQALKRR